MPMGTLDISNGRRWMKKLQVNRERPARTSFVDVNPESADELISDKKKRITVWNVSGTLKVSYGSSQRIIIELDIIKSVQSDFPSS